MGGGGTLKISGAKVCAPNFKTVSAPMAEPPIVYVFLIREAISLVNFAQCQ